MLKAKSIFIYLTLIGLISCVSKKTELINLNFEKDLIPEGFAIDGRKKEIYLNSLKSNKIVSSSIDGNNPKVFLETNKHNYLAGFGMTVKGDTLYALGNSLTEGKNKSILLLLQLSTGNLIDSYSLNNSDFHYWNDLAISSSNEIFITDSESNKIYKIQRPNKAIEIYMDSKEIPNSNGITISDNDEYLYLASENGICVIETTSKKLINKPNEDYSSIDGLKFHKKNLYGMVNGWGDQSQNGLFKFELNKARTEILKSEKLIDFKENFRIPTTFDIFDGNIYFVINTQLDNFDEKKNKILDLKKLQSYKMMKTRAK
jgi:DNA-binding beta-propeller fold protein YncE